MECAKVSPEESACVSSPTKPQVLKYKEALKEFQRKYYKEILLDAKGSVVIAAITAGLNRTQVYNKLRELGIDIKDYQELRPDREETMRRKAQLLGEASL